MNNLIQVFKNFLAPLIKELYKSQGFIAIFHSVGHRYNELNSGLVISVTKFLEFIEFWKGEGYSFVSIEDIPECIRKKKKFVVITFDDGYQDNFDVFYKFLKPQKIPATFYITTEFIDNKVKPWWTGIAEHLTQNTALSRQLISRFGIDPVKTTAEKFTALRDELNRSNLEIRAELLIELQEYQVENSYDHNFLSSYQLRQLAMEELVTIGNHTFSHPALNVLSNGELEEEVSKCQKHLESITSYPIRHFSVPFGTEKEANESTCEKLEDFGFDSVVLGIHGGIRMEHLSRMGRLPRIYIGDETDFNNLKSYLSGSGAFKMHAKKRFIT